MGNLDSGNLLHVFLDKIYLIRKTIYTMPVKIPETILDYSKDIHSRWHSALQNLPDFSASDFRKDFNKHMRPLYDSLSSPIKRLILEVTKNPLILFSHQHFEELAAFSSILEIPFHHLVFQNIIYELFCVDTHTLSASVLGCTTVILNESQTGTPLMGRNVDFDYSDYWRKYSFNARLINQKGTGKFTLFSFCHGSIQ